MESDLAQLRQQAHRMIDLLPDDKVLVVLALLRVLLDPEAQALVNDHYDNKPVAPPDIREPLSS